MYIIYTNISQSVPCTIYSTLKLHISSMSPPYSNYKINILQSYFLLLLYQNLLLSFRPEIVFLDNPYSFHIQSLNNLANPFTNVLSQVATKYTILINLSTTTKIISYILLYDSFKMKSAIICIQDFSGTILSISFSTSISILCLFL